MIVSVILGINGKHSVNVCMPLIWDDVITPKKDQMVVLALNRTNCFIQYCCCDCQACLSSLKPTA